MDYIKHVMKCIHIKFLANYATYCNQVL